MAQLVVAAAGAAVGFMVAGPTGAQIGWAAGSMIGGAMFAPVQKSVGPRLDDLKVTTSSYGTPIPYIQGSPRVAGQIIWASAKREIANTTSQGKGGGSEYTSYTYEVDLLILLADNPIAGVSRIWSSGNLIYNVLASATQASRDASYTTPAWQRLTVYGGAASQLPDPTYEAAVGVSNAPAYRGRGTVFIQGLQLGGGGQIPNLTFETFTAGTFAADNGQFLLRWDATDARFENLPANLPVTLTSDGALTVAPDSGRLLGGLPSLKFNASAGTTRPTFSANNGGIVPLAGVASVPPSGDCTLEMFVYLEYAQAQRGGWLFNDGGLGYAFAGPYDPSAVSNQGALSCFITTEGALRFFAGKGQSTVDALKMEIAPTRSLPFDVWAHLAFVRTGVTWTLYLDGDTLGSGTQLQPLSLQSNFFLGGIFSQGNPVLTTIGNFVGSLGEVRLFTTRAIYSGPFPRPQAPLADFVSVSLTPPAVSAVVSSLCTLGGLAPAQIDATALAPILRPVRALSVGQVSSVRTVLEMLAASYHFDCVLSDKIYFRPRGVPPVSSLVWDDLGVQDTEPLPMRVTNELEVPAQMALTYSAIENDYQTDTQYSDRLLTGQESTSAVTLPLAFLSTEAKQIVDAMLLDKAISITNTTLTQQQRYTALEPSDVLIVQDQQSGNWRLRVVKKVEAAGVVTLDCVMDDATVFTQPGITSTGTQGQSAVAPTPATSALLLDVPLLRDADNSPGIYIAVAGSAGWKNAAIFESLNDSTYTQLTTVADAATLGTCTTALPDWAGGNVFDEASTVTVAVGIGQLVSVTRETLLQDQTVNAALIGTELVQYRTAQLVSAGVYTLSSLLRGRKGTERAMASHVVGDRFVALGASGLRYLPLQAADLGRARFYKAASAGQKLSEVLAIATTPAGVALECLSPVNARANRNTVDTAITWTRRTRLSTRLVGALPISAPLGETAESYELEIYTAGFATLRRTISTSSPNCTYTSAQQVADFGSNQAVLYLKIYQLSSTVGRGYPLTVSI